MKRRLSALLLLLALAVCAGAAAPETPGPFSDVPADAWYADAVAEVCALGLMRGTARDAFSPDQLVTPVEAAVVLYRLAGSPSDAPPVPGIPQDAWYTPALNWYQSQGHLRHRHLRWNTRRAAGRRASGPAVCRVHVLPLFRVQRSGGPGL